MFLFILTKLEGGISSPPEKDLGNPHEIAANGGLAPAVLHKEGQEFFYRTNVRFYLTPVDTILVMRNRV